MPPLSREPTGLMKREQVYSVVVRDKSFGWMYIPESIEITNSAGSYTDSVIYENGCEEDPRNEVFTR